MKKFGSICLILFLLFVDTMIAKTPPEVIKQFKYIIGLINDDHIAELASQIDYPLKRDNPLPNILSANEFILYYSVLIDSELKKKLSHFNDTDIMEHYGHYGLVGGIFTGEIWIDETGKVLTINYSSQNEKNLQQKLTNEIQQQVNSSVKPWKRNILVWENDKFLIRIDDTDEGLRYVSWSKNHKISDKPDLILNHGVEEAQGTMGGWTWTFVNGKWTYIVDDVEMCEKEDKCGLFLHILYDNIEKSTLRFKETK